MLYSKENTILIYLFIYKGFFYHSIFVNKILAPLFFFCCFKTSCWFFSKFLTDFKPSGFSNSVMATSRNAPRLQLITFCSVCGSNSSKSFSKKPLLAKIFLVNICTAGDSIKFVPSSGVKGWAIFLANFSNNFEQGTFPSGQLLIKAPKNSVKTLELRNLSTSLAA